jgi:hypothetical protein
VAWLAGASIVEVVPWLAIVGFLAVAAYTAGRARRSGGERAAGPRPRGVSPVGPQQAVAGRRFHPMG